MARYFISMYTDGPATRWNVIDRATQEWVRRFSTEAEAIEFAALHNRPRKPVIGHPKLVEGLTLNGFVVHGYEHGHIIKITPKTFTVLFRDGEATFPRLDIDDEEVFAEAAE